MKSRIGLTLAITLAVVLTLGLGMPGRAQDKEEMHGKEMKKEQMHGEGMMMMKDMSFIFTADTLYTCPMHPDYVTDKPGRCGISGCDAELVKMSEEAVKKLRESHPKACTMCGLVFPGDSKVDRCPSCNMGLKPVEKPAEEGAKKHEMHSH